MGYTNKKYITIYMGAVPLQRSVFTNKNYITVYKGAVPLKDGVHKKHITVYMGEVPIQRWGTSKIILLYTWGWFHYKDQEKKTTISFSNYKGQFLSKDGGTIIINIGMVYLQGVESWNLKKQNKIMLPGFNMFIY